MAVGNSLPEVRYLDKKLVKIGNTFTYEYGPIDGRPQSNDRSVVNSDHLVKYPDNLCKRKRSAVG